LGAGAAPAARAMVRRARAAETVPPGLRTCGMRARAAVQAEAPVAEQVLRKDLGREVWADLGQASVVSAIAAAAPVPAVELARDQAAAPVAAVERARDQAAGPGRPAAPGLVEKVLRAGG
jgi:hypothetical protein